MTCPEVSHKNRMFFINYLKQFMKKTSVSNDTSFLTAGKLDGQYKQRQIESSTQSIPSMLGPSPPAPESPTSPWEEGELSRLGIVIWS